MENTSSDLKKKFQNIDISCRNLKLSLLASDGWANKLDCLSLASLDHLV
jgi:hypothetical protein